VDYRTWLDPSVRCGSCGQENPAGFRFCGSCGAPVTEARAREVRKVVTVVFCDLSGSTAMGERADPEALRGRLRGYYEQMRQILERHGGTVEKFIGDAVMAVFGVPVAHEDDALRAVRAAWEMRAAVPRLGLQARIGVNTGEVVAGEGDTLVSGDAVNVAARLEQAAEAGEVLIGAETRRLVRDAVTVEPVQVTVKGKTEPVAACRLLNVDPGAAAVARRLGTPLIGRRFELQQLRQAFERSVRERRCHLFTVLGAAGVGKSRLAAEFVSGLDATVLAGRCLDYGEGITFWPVVSVLKQLGERAEETLARLVDGGFSQGELFWDVRAQLENVAHERPLVVVFDDIHWGEETFLDLIDHVADLSRGASILLLCLARPDLLDKRPTWGGGKLNATTILLEPLTADECAELIEAHGGTEPGTRERIVASADGNPLFVEEMLALVREGGDVGTPSTVRALLQARLDQLARGERTVIEGGAIEGEIFHRSAVVELARSPDVESQLLGLVRKELIHPAAPTLSGDEAFRFRHLLFRDAAYDALPKETRAELHERFADWLGQHGQELIELDEILGYHLEQAARYRRELDRADPELERRAGRHLAAAGSRATMRSDSHGAANLLGRALALLPPGDRLRPSAVLDCIGILEELGEREHRLRLIEELEQADDPAVRMHGRVARSAFRVMTEPADAVEEAEAVAEEALTVFAAAGDDLGMAYAYDLAASTSWTRSRAVPTVRAIEAMLLHAERAGSRLLAGRAMMMLIGPLNYGPFETELIRAKLAQLPANESPLATVNVLWVEAELASREKRFTDALDLLEQASAIPRELGLEIFTALHSGRRAEIMHDQGRLDEAIRTYREAISRLEELGQTGFRSTTLINLAEVLYERGQADEAARLALEGEQTGGAEDVVNFAYGRALRARIAADRGAPGTADALAREALDYAYKTDFPSVHATVHEALGHVLAAAGRPDEARAELDRALQLWQRYGHRAQAERTRALLASL
jgi:class 3 adenylate cyclase/tetratricopeptide (TPR) repeat protein